MVTITGLTTFQRGDGIIEAEAVVTAANGDSISSGELDLGTISRVKSVQPLVADHVAGAASITAADSLNNSVTLNLYILTAGGDSLEEVAADSAVDWFITAQQV